MYAVNGNQAQSCIDHTSSDLYPLAKQTCDKIKDYKNRIESSYKKCFLYDYPNIVCHAFHLLTFRIL